MLRSFLFLDENICCGYSLEAPRRGASNEYHNICFRQEIRKILCGYPLLSVAMINLSRVTTLTTEFSSFCVDDNAIWRNCVIHRKVDQPTDIKVNFRNLLHHRLESVRGRLKKMITTLELLGIFWLILSLREYKQTDITIIYFAKSSDTVPHYRLLSWG